MYCNSISARDHFEKISLHCGHFADLIPVTFVLGFYVSVVITRWWQQFESIPWPGNFEVKCTLTEIIKRRNGIEDKHSYSPNI